MSEEKEDLSWEGQFKRLLEKDDNTALKELLDDQNISDVADLINEYPDYEARIIVVRLFACFRHQLSKSIVCGRFQLPLYQHSF